MPAFLAAAATLGAALKALPGLATIVEIGSGVAAYLGANWWFWTAAGWIEWALPAACAVLYQTAAGSITATLNGVWWIWNGATWAGVAAGSALVAGAQIIATSAKAIATFVAANAAEFGLVAACVAIFGVAYTDVITSVKQTPLPHSACSRSIWHCSDANQTRAHALPRHRDSKHCGRHVRA